MSLLAVASLGGPSIGPRRELKFALESYWAGKTDAEALLKTAAGLRAASWAQQQAVGVEILPSNDFSLYDSMLDTAVMVGAVPARYGWQGGAVPLDTYFAMARGTHGRAQDVAALEMTKWFDTNYHYMVPEFTADQSFTLSTLKPVEEYLEACALGYNTRPVLIGPVSFLRLGKCSGADTLSLLPRLLPVYGELLQRLAKAGAKWVQIDEPVLATDLDAGALAALVQSYAALSHAAPGLKILLASYFGDFGTALDTVVHLPVAGLHLDLVRGHEQLGEVLAKAPRDRVLSLGVIDGRNIWRADLEKLIFGLKPVLAAWAPEQLQLAPSCSLKHVPIDVTVETELAEDVKSWLSFAVQKMGELASLHTALTAGESAVADKLAAASAALAARRLSATVHRADVAARMAHVTPAMATRNSPFADRIARQQAHLKLPAFPTTTIGSFPQTDEVRAARAAHAKGNVSDADYVDFLRAETALAIRWQEEVGLDVLVHGEFERNDMVQYFGEQLDGYAFTKHGWVQSYGSRYVRPPVIYGDVARPRPMTVAWARYAQSLTEKPVKGMLTGPVTMLQWSFVRDDLPRSAVCRQIALALRDEVTDLEAAGIRVIQIDEPALREGLPLRCDDWQGYLNWAVEAFRLASSGVADETQIHTHMCYAEFNDIIAAIGALDADVISIETARSQMELLSAFAEYRYPNAIGPGVYDIHSPRIPAVTEIVTLLSKASERLSPGQIWVNPDCGLKTRRWEEVKPALCAMTDAARQMRG